MSFFILRNRDNQPANSFSCDFQNSFTIPANSEVALHSMALNREDKFDLSDAKLYVYHGPEINADGTSKDGGANRLSFTMEIELTDGAYTPAELAAHVQGRLRQQDFHPNYQQLWTCTATLSGTTYTGLQFECGQVAPATGESAAAKPAAMVNTSTEDPASFTYDTSTGEVAHTGEFHEDLWVRTQKPMNLNGGEYVVDFSDLYELSNDGDISLANAVGISRNYLVDDMEYYKGDFYDTYVVIDDGSNGTKGDVNVYNKLIDPEQLEYEERDTKYWTADPDSDFSDLTGPMNLITLPSSHNTTNYNAFKFKFENEQVSIYLGKSTDSTSWELLTKTTNKPVSHANVAVYPKVYIPHGKSCTFVHQDAITDYYSQYADIQDVDVDNVAGGHFKFMAFQADQAVTAALSEAGKWTAARGVKSPAMGQHYLDYDCGMVLLPSPDIYFNLDDADVGEQFGYVDANVFATVTEAAASAKSTFTPGSTAVTTVGDDLTFVRCSTLTQRSLNGETKSVSRIICDVPRYIQSAQYGRLFYTPPEKTYLKLHNKEPITLNQLSIEVVNANERLVSDLSGETTVMLHIKSCNCHK
eukprot:SAG22_NODE_1272_length_4923_cov_3.681385_3_plen_585_part_00